MRWGPCPGEPAPRGQRACWGTCRDQGTAVPRSSLVLCPAAGSRGPAGGLAAAPPPGGCCARAQATPPHGRRLQGAWLCVSQAGPVRGDLCPGAAAGERLLCWELTGPPSRGCGCAGRRLCGTLWKAPGGRARSVWRERRRVRAALGDRPAVGFVPFSLAPGPAWLEERWPRGQGASACRAPAPRCRDSRVLQWGRVASLARTIFSRVYLTAQTGRLSWGRKCSSAGSAAGFPAEPQRWPEAPCPRPGAGGSVHGRALTSAEEGRGTRGVARAHASLGPRPGAGAPAVRSASRLRRHLHPAGPGPREASRPWPLASSDTSAPCGRAGGGFRPAGPRGQGVAEGGAGPEWGRLVPSPDCRGAPPRHRQPVSVRSAHCRRRRGEDVVPGRSPTHPPPGPAAPRALAPGRPRGRGRWAAWAPAVPGVAPLSIPRPRVGGPRGPPSLPLTGSEKDPVHTFGV